MVLLEIAVRFAIPVVLFDSAVCTCVIVGVDSFRKTRKATLSN